MSNSKSRDKQKLKEINLKKGIFPQKDKDIVEGHEDNVEPIAWPEKVP